MIIKFSCVKNLKKCIAINIMQGKESRSESISVLSKQNVKNGKVEKQNKGKRPARMRKDKYIKLPKISSGKTSYCNVYKVDEEMFVGFMYLF